MEDSNSVFIKTSLLKIISPLKKPAFSPFLMVTEVPEYLSSVSRQFHEYFWIYEAFWRRVQQWKKLNERCEENNWKSLCKGGWRICKGENCSWRCRDNLLHCIRQDIKQQKNLYSWQLGWHKSSCVRKWKGSKSNNRSQRIKWNRKKTNSVILL